MESQDKAERVPVGYVGREDLPGFVSALFDQYEEVNQLSWHDGASPQNEIFMKVAGDHGGASPQNEIFIKVAGDHGRDSFKFMLQVGSVKTPNSKNNTFLLAIVNAKDFHKNIRRVLRPCK